ncbi:MAG: sialidase family protein [Spirosomataceae bacterium]
MNSFRLRLLGALMVLTGVIAHATPTLNDTTKAYSMPLLARTPQGAVVLSWTEKDKQGLVSFCLSVSTDKGQNFSDKKVIFAGPGIGNSRLMRAKVLFKKDGTWVAVFSNRGEGAPQGKRSSDIVYCVSKDQGNTWTPPQVVDTDPTKGVRGFFDAVVLANDEIAVAYLKDVANSTKHEERDLRMAVTKNGVFQPEKLVDPVVCDCCNISLLVDAKGTLNVYYRDNNDDIRDIARMTSNDNGATFNKSQILFQDGWKIAGCPHSGASSITLGKGALVTWYSGTNNEPGTRLVTQEGKRLLTLDAAAKNAYLAGNGTTGVLLWEQNASESNLSQIAYRKINADKLSDVTWVKESVNATNAAAMVVDNQLIVAYEVKQPNKRNSLSIASVAL